MRLEDIPQPDGVGGYQLRPANSAMDEDAYCLMSRMPSFCSGCDRRIPTQPCMRSRYPLSRRYTNSNLDTNSAWYPNTSQGIVCINPTQPGCGRYKLCRG